MPLAPRLESTRGASSRTGQNALEIAHRHRGGDEDASRRRAAPSPSARATFGSLSSSPSGARRGAPRRARRRRASVEPGRVGGGAGAAAGAGRRAARGRRPTPGSCQAPCGSTSDLPGVGEAGEPGAQRLRRRQVADADHDLGRVRAGEARRRAAAGRSGRSRRRRGARPTAGRRAAGSRARRRARGSRARGRASSRPATITPRARAVDGDARRRAPAGPRERRPMDARRRGPA